MCLAKIRKQQPDIVGFDQMREDDERRNVKWLTESIDRLLARERIDWAKKTPTEVAYERRA